MFAHSEVFQIEFLSKHVFFGLCKSIFVNPLFCFLKSSPSSVPIGTIFNLVLSGNSIDRLTSFFDTLDGKWQKIIRNKKFQNTTI